MTELSDRALGVRLWRFAWPMIAIGWLRTLLLVVDVWWVARLGGAPLEALAAGSFAGWIMDWLSEISAMGVQARIAQAEGAGKPQRFGKIIASGASVTLLLVVVLWGAAPFLVGGYLDLLGTQDSLRSDAYAWLIAMCHVAVGPYVLELVSGTLRGRGQMKRALGVGAIALVLNILLDPIFLMGWWGVPAFGLPGAAYATSVACIVAAGVGLVWIAGDNLAWQPPNLREAAAIVTTGGPPALAGIFFALVYVVLGRQITAHGPSVLAGMGIGHRLESLPFLASVGLSQATTTLVGRAWGAKDQALLSQTMRIVRRAVWVVMAGVSVFGFVGAGLLFAWITPEVEIQIAGVSYFQAQAAVFIFLALEQVYAGAFVGMGRTVFVFWITAIFTAVRIPLAYALDQELGFGAAGIWWAIALTTVIKAVLLQTAFETRVKKSWVSCT